MAMELIRPVKVGAKTGRRVIGNVLIIKNNTNIAAKNQAQFDVDAILFPFYRTHNDTRPAKKLSLSDVVQLLESPRIGPKETAPLLTPYDADAKTKPVAQESLYYCLPIDHDHDNLTADGIRARYDPYNVAYIAWTTSYHQQDGNGNRWKVLILFSDPCSFDMWIELARGAALMVEGDEAQARSQQGFYGPNKLTDDAPYGYIIHLDRPFVDPAEPFHALINDCLTAYTKELEEQKKQAAAAMPKPRRVNGTDGSIIDLINAAWPMEEALAAAGVKRVGKKYLSAQSESMSPGGVILNRDGKQVYYSHHGTNDPLSQQNNGGHSLDTADVLCITQYGGDVSQMVRDLAPQVDPEGQKQRQREYMEQQSTAAADFSEYKTDDGSGGAFDLSKFSLYGRSKNMEAKMLNDVYILGKLAILGQSTVWYAKPNTGKTLLVIHLLIQAIREGVIKGENVYYVNADDTYKGLVYKLKIAEKWGFHQLAPGHGPDSNSIFKAEHLPGYLAAMIQQDTAKDKALILDTVKKFTDLMCKDKSSKFGEQVRQFVSHGGTVIMLAHANKHRDDDKKIVYAGTADLVDDADCAYTIDDIGTDSDGFRTVKFENFKARGDVAPEAYYKYDARGDVNYFDRLDSITAIDEDERHRAEERRAMDKLLAKNQLAVDAIIESIKDGVTGETALVADAAERSGISKPKITKALIDHTGPDTSKHQFWFIDPGERNSKNYRLNYGVKS
jgi:hypothetical protein